MKVTVGHHLLEAYPVENYVYEVSYCGRYLRKIGLIPLLIMLYVAIWIVLAIFK